MDINNNKSDQLTSEQSQTKEEIIKQNDVKKPIKYSGLSNQGIV